MGATESVVAARPRIAARAGELAGPLGVFVLTGAAALLADQAWGAEPWLLPLAIAAGLALSAATVVRWMAAREASRRAARMRREFAAGMSHDLRTPLAQIQMFTEMLLLHRDRTEREREQWLRVIEREALALGGVVDNLLLLAHGPDARAFPAREPVDLAELVEDVAAAFSPRAAAVRMTVSADPPAGIRVRADRRALTRAVANLVDNALRFGPEGQDVTLAVVERNGLAELTVTDAGPGLPPDARERLIHPSDSPLELHARPHGGHGLGIAVVAEVVRAHGGSATAEPVPGGGTRVRLLLPLATSAGSPAGRP